MSFFIFFCMYSTVFIQITPLICINKNYFTINHSSLFFQFSGGSSFVISFLILFCICVIIFSVITLMSMSSSHILAGFLLKYSAFRYKKPEFNEYSRNSGSFPNRSSKFKPDLSNRANTVKKARASHLSILNRQ